MHITVLAVLESAIQLFGSFLLVVLKQNEGLTKIPLRYTNYTDIFYSDFAIKLLKNIGINKHANKLVKNKQLLYKLIYNLDQMKLETLKTYIKIHSKTRFILLFKSLVEASVFFYKKPNGNLCLYINY